MWPLSHPRPLPSPRQPLGIGNMGLTPTSATELRSGQNHRSGRKGYACATGIFPRHMSTNHWSTCATP